MVLEIGFVLRTKGRLSDEGLWIIDDLGRAGPHVKRGAKWGGVGRGRGFSIFGLLFAIWAVDGTGWVIGFSSL